MWIKAFDKDGRLIFEGEGGLGSLPRDQLDRISFAKLCLAGRAGRGQPFRYFRLLVAVGVHKLGRLLYPGLPTHRRGETSTEGQKEYREVVEGIWSKGTQSIAYPVEKSMGRASPDSSDDLQQ